MVNKKLYLGTLTLPVLGRLGLRTSTPKLFALVDCFMGIRNLSFGYSLFSLFPFPFVNLGKVIALIEWLKCKRCKSCY